MHGRLKLHLKANERIFVNGGVLRVDRKVAIELLNDVVFLLESHVMQAEQATTAVRQLYFIVQSMLMEPASLPIGRLAYDDAHRALIATYRDRTILEGLVEVRLLVQGCKPFDALKRLRALFALEDELLGHKSAATQVA